MFTWKGRHLVLALFASTINTSTEIKQISKGLLSLIYKNNKKHKFIKRNIGVLLFCRYRKALNDIMLMLLIIL